LPMQSWYISCHVIASGSMTDKFALKMFASSVIFTNAMCDALFMALIILSCASNLAACTFYLSSPNFT
jgi:hypothetical protein